MSNHVYGMSRDLAFSPIWSDHLFPMHHRALSPGMIGSLSENYVRELQELFSVWQGRLQVTDTEEGLLIDLADSVFDIMVRQSRFPSLIPSTSVHCLF